MVWRAPAVGASVCGVVGKVGGPVQAATMGVLTQPVTEGPTHGNSGRHHSRPEISEEPTGSVGKADKRSGATCDKAAGAAAHVNGSNWQACRRHNFRSVRAASTAADSIETRRASTLFLSAESFSVAGLSSPEHIRNRALEVLRISGLRLCGLGAFGLFEVRPDQPVVIRAEVLTTDCATRSALNCKAVRRTWLPLGIAVLPLAYLGVALCPNAISKLGNRQRTRTG